MKGLPIHKKGSATTTAEIGSGACALGQKSASPIHAWKSGCRYANKHQSGAHQPHSTAKRFSSTLTGVRESPSKGCSGTCALYHPDFPCLGLPGQGSRAFFVAK
jgi:hypothetical protein